MSPVNSDPHAPASVFPGHEVQYINFLLVTPLDAQIYTLCRYIYIYVVVVLDMLPDIIGS